jgi:hypothetical protein
MNNKTASIELDVKRPPINQPTNHCIVTHTAKPQTPNCQSD